MGCFKKCRTRDALCLSILLTVLSLAVVGTATAANFRDDIPVPFSQIQWDHPDVSHWPITSDLATVYIENGELYLRNSKECDWPPFPGAVSANASTWSIHKGRDGTWRANNWDHVRRCQHWRHDGAVGSGFDGWTPKAGETVYFFVSGQARPGYPSNVQERTNVVKYVWHRAPGEALPGISCEEPPVIDSFTATPNPVVLGPTGLLGSKKDHNVKISWNISNADSAELVTDNGEKTEYSANNNLQLLIDKPTTFVLYGKTGCTAEADWPSKTLRVNVGPPSTSYLSNLLLYSGPKVTTLTNYDETSHNPINVTMHGEVDTTSQEVVATFEYGKTTNYGTVVNAVPHTIAKGVIKKPISATATNLAKGTLYHYRAKVTGRGRTTFGEDQTFTTDNLPGVATNGFSYHPSYAGTVTLKGLVTPNGDTTTVTFQYGVGIGNFVSSIAGSALGSPASTSTTPQPSSALVTGLDPDTTYQFRVCAKNSVGPLQCSSAATVVTFAVPDVETSLIDDTTVTDSGATLKGRVDPNRNATTVTFEWGLSSEPAGTYGSSEVLPQKVTGDGWQDVSTTIGGLTQGMTYKYRVTAFNDYGPAEDGADKTFTTDSPPEVTTLDAVILSSEDVTLRADIVPHGAETSVMFQHNGGICPEDPDTATWFNSVDVLTTVPYDSTGQTVVYLLTGRAPGATYCYRASADNGIGNPVYGDPVQFTLPLPGQ